MCYYIQIMNRAHNLVLYTSDKKLSTKQWYKLILGFFPKLYLDVIYILQIHKRRKLL